MKLLIDEMLWPAIAEQLRNRGHDAQTIVDANLRSASDKEILVTALADERVVVTDNVKDFRRLIQEAVESGTPYASVIYCANRPFPRSRPRTLGRVVSALEALLQHGVDSRNAEYWL